MKQKNIIALSLIVLMSLLILSVEAKEKWQGRRGENNRQFAQSGHPRMGEGMSEEQLSEIINELDELEPGIKTLFTELKETDDATIKRHLRELSHDHGFKFIGRKKSSDASSLFAKTLKLELESLKITNQITASTDESVKESLKNELRNKLYDSFEAKTELRAYHIKRMTEKLEEISKQNEERQTNKDQIVEKRLNDLIEDQGNLDW